MAEKTPKERKPENIESSKNSQNQEKEITQLQRSIGMIEDGKLGPRTIAYLQAQTNFEGDDPNTLLYLAKHKLILGEKESISNSLGQEIQVHKISNRPNECLYINANRKLYTHIRVINGELQIKDLADDYQNTENKGTATATSKITDLALGKEHPNLSTPTIEAICKIMNITIIPQSDEVQRNRVVMTSNNQINYYTTSPKGEVEQFTFVINHEDATLKTTNKPEIATNIPDSISLKELIQNSGKGTTFQLTPEVYTTFIKGLYSTMKVSESKNKNKCYSKIYPNLNFAIYGEENQPPGIIEFSNNQFTITYKNKTTTKTREEISNRINNQKLSKPLQALFQSLLQETETPTATPSTPSALASTPKDGKEPETT